VSKRIALTARGEATRRTIRDAVTEVERDCGFCSVRSVFPR